MGSLQTIEMANQVREGNLPLRSALLWHLESNHFPPQPASLAVLCERAIEAGNEQDFERVIYTTPRGITLTAERVIDHLHLEAFVDWDW
jgi:hypothetical protein